MLCLVAFAASLGTPHTARLSAFVQLTNCSLKLPDYSSSLKRHPLFVLSRLSHPGRFSIFSSKFVRFSSPIIQSNSHPISLHDVVFAHSMSQAIVLTSTPIVGIDHSERKIISGGEPSTFTKCTFNAISSIQETAKEATGGALYCQGCTLSFSHCMFSGNSAVTAGCAYFDQCDVTMESCNFTNNRATYVVGCLYFEKTHGKIRDCYFVGNEGEIYTGVLKLVDSNCECQGAIFHANKAAYQTCVVDYEKSNVVFTGTQFSANVLTRELGGVVHSLKASTVQLIGCRFATHITDFAGKRPLKVDSESTLQSVSCCFDVHDEEELKKDSDGVITIDLGTMFMTECPCKAVVLPAAYDIVDVNIVLHSEFVTHKFVITALALLATACVVAIVFVFGEGKVKTEWVALL